VVLSLIAIVCVGFVALVQQDAEKLIAYSSVAHMGFVTLGIFLPLLLMRNSATPIRSQRISARAGHVVQVDFARPRFGRDVLVHGRDLRSHARTCGDQGLRRRPPNTHAVVCPRSWCFLDGELRFCPAPPVLSAKVHGDPVGLRVKPWILISPH
jgi:hypothetical protein